MRIGFIGAGRVGCTLGRYLEDHGANVAGYFSRTREHAEEAARFTDTLCYDTDIDLANDADVIFITVRDDAISDVFQKLNSSCPLEGKILCHTSGALTSAVFDGCGVYGYSIHPIYAVNDRFTAIENFQNAYITIEGHEKYRDDLLRLFQDAGLSAAVITAENKPKYHAAAVMASNMVCGIYGMATRLLTECGFQPEDAHRALSGLFLDNARGITEKGPVGQLTGPIERGDIRTVEKHMEVLSPEDRKTYLALAGEVLRLAVKKNGEDKAYEELSRYISGNEGEG